MTDMTETLEPIRAVPADGRRMNDEKIARNRSEEPGLIEAWQRNGCAPSLTTLITRYKPMIGSQIQRILAGRSVGTAHRQDLEQEATLAFIGAVSAFDPAFGAHLSSFAINHVRANLLRYALDYRHSYRIGTSSSERKAFYAALSRRAERIHAGQSDLLSDEDISKIQKNTGASIKSAQRAVAAIYARRSSIEDEPDLVDENTRDICERTFSLDTAMAALNPFLRTLDERQSAILQIYLSDGETDAHRLAEHFGISTERVGQIRRDLLADMAIFLKKKGITAADVF